MCEQEVNMRKGFLFVGLMIMLLGLLGCQASSKPLEPDQRPNQVVDPSASDYPAEVRNWLNNMKPYQVAGVIERGGKTYFMVSGGEQRTGGHEVKISLVSSAGNQLTVQVDFIKPDGPATQALSYPYVVYVMDKSFDDDKDVVFVNSADNKRIPQIIGCQPTRPFLDSSNSIKIIEMDLEDNEVEVEGIARVKDGTVYYRFINGEGQTVSQGKVTAEAKAPDWGCFELDDLERPAGATHIELFWMDPQGQLREDIVRIPL
jgi:hypothetical protein